MDDEATISFIVQCTLYSHSCTVKNAPFTRDILECGQIDLTRVEKCTKATSRLHRFVIIVVITFALSLYPRHDI